MQTRNYHREQDKKAQLTADETDSRTRPSPGVAAELTRLEPDRSGVVMDGAMDA